MLDTSKEIQPLFFLCFQPYLLPRYLLTDISRLSLWHTLNRSQEVFWQSCLSIPCFGCHHQYMQCLSFCVHSFFQQYIAIIEYGQFFSYFSMFFIQVVFLQKSDEELISFFEVFRIVYHLSLMLYKASSSSLNIGKNFPDGIFAMTVNSNSSKI